MANPTEFDEYFFLGALLIFLMINYNLNLANIYNNIVIFIIIGYLVPIIFNMFRWGQISKGNKIKSTITGAIFAGVFIYIYNSLATASPIEQVFATTAFGESELIGKIVFGVLIAVIETIFFFRILPQWFAYLRGWRWETIEPWEKEGLMLNSFFSAVFTIFHSTSKGITNNTDLIVTFVFAFISIAMILYFKEVWQAIVFHVVVNSWSVKLFETGSVLTPGTLIIVGIIYVIYKQKNHFKLPI